MRKTAARPLSAPQSVRLPPRRRQPALVDVERRGGTDVAEQVLVGLVEGQGGVLQDRLEEAHGDARSEGSRRHIGRQLGARHGAAVRAAQPLQAMLAEDDLGQRQLSDLMARGLPERLAFGRAEDVAAAAVRGPVVDELVERRDRRQMTTASRMARLGAGPPARSRLMRSRWCRGWIGRGWQRGVARGSVEALFKVGNADLKPPVRLAQLGDLSPEQSVLRRELQEHSDDRFTSLLIDRLSLGALHAQGLRGVGVRACPVSYTHLTLPTKRIV